MVQDPALNEDRERRKHVRLRLRPDLQFTAQTYEGATYHVVKDPAGLAYYRFDEYDRFLLSRMNGLHTLDELREAFEAQFRPRRLEQEDLETFGQNLLQTGLAVHDQPQAGQQLYELNRKRRLREWLQVFTNILYVEIPLFDPDPLLTRLLPLVRWAFNPVAFVAGLALMLAALLLVGTHFREFEARLPDAQAFFGFKNVAYLWIAVGLVKIFHEFGHGLACKAQGGESHDLGLLFMCLSPCLYVNVTDAWALPTKRQRMAVGVAGVYVELVIASVATFLWWRTPDGSTIHQLALSLVVVASVNTLMFNGNPLLRYDAYYVLADWLEVPNLRERCNRYLKNLALTYCLGVESVPEPPMALARRVFFAVYAVASYVYGWVVAFTVLWTLSRFLQPYKLGSVSMLLAVASAASMIGWPLYNVGQNIYKRGKLPETEPPKVALTLCLLAVLVAAFFLLPLPVSRVRQAGLVQIRPDAIERVYVPQSATLERVLVRDGETVQPGDLLAEFRSRDLEDDLEEARGQFSGRAVQIRALVQQALDTIDPQEKSRLESAISQADGERTIYARQVEVLEKKLRSLMIRAPRAGVVLGAPRPEDLGKLWEKEQGTPVCGVGDPSQLRVIFPLPPADFHLIQQDAGPSHKLPVTVRVKGWEGATWKARLTPLPESEVQDVPLALSTKAGGPLPTRPGSRPNTLEPQGQHYLVAVDLQGAEHDPIWPGAAAQVKVACRWRSPAWWLRRTIASLFDVNVI